ncbi:MAG: hypothetical protein NC131_05305 [Roseburia sp.]|nr:hypothetical protein [Roseburia sp.]
MSVKRIINIFAVAICALSLMCVFAACNKDSSDSENIKPVTGQFYTLQEAYDNGYITQTDLENIAYYHNGEKSYPESLDENIANSIKSDWAKKLSDDETDSADNTVEISVVIRGYYGTYGNCVAVIVERKGTVYVDVYRPIVVQIGNVTFKYNLNHPQIIVWKATV